MMRADDENENLDVLANEDIAALARTDSLLSQEDEEEEEEENFRNSDTTLQYIEEASMEASPFDHSQEMKPPGSPRRMKIRPSGPKGQRYISVSESEVIPTIETDKDESSEGEVTKKDLLVDDSERGHFESVRRRSSHDRKSAFENLPSKPPRASPPLTEAASPLAVDSVTLLTSNEVLEQASISDSQALFDIFRGFSDPAISLETAQAILDVERGDLSKLPVALPDPVTIILRREPSAVHRLLQKQILLLRLPADFTAAFLRILIRLLTLESDDDFAQACFGKGLPPMDQSPLPDADHATRRPHILYNVARLQCQASVDLWEVWQAAVRSKLTWVPALARLMGLLAVGNCTPRSLRRWLQWTGGSQNPAARLALVAALKTAAAAACRSSVLQSAPSYFFCFGGQGLKRTISGLAAWPFRNDFGMAMWFRAEQFGDNHILFKARADDGGGLEVSLAKIQDQAATVAVSVYDAGDKDRSHYLQVRACVLLPRVWYHLGIRHTRSRLKGVFSLQTRQQISILIDGKLMLTEALPFPKVSQSDFRDDASSFVPSLRRSMSQQSRLNLHLSMGEGFDGEIGTLFLFHESVSDASFRALYETTGGTRGVARRGSSSSDAWSSRRSKLVQRSRVLDANMTSGDADELVLAQSHRRKAGILHEKLTAVMDMGGETDDTEDTAFPLMLQKASFASKVLVTWDPRRVLGSLALDLHMGAHVRMEHVYSWGVNAAQDTIGSIGGVQALIPLFRSFLSPSGEQTLLETGKTDNPLFEQPVACAVPTLLDMLSTFVSDHNDNARELLRCGGIDIVADLLATGKKYAIGKRLKFSVFGALSSDLFVSTRLTDSLLRLESACSHYIALETKVFSRLLFNVPLWFGGRARYEASALQSVLLPLLSVLTRMSPDRVRACVKVRDMVQVLHDVCAPALSESACSEDLEENVEKVQFALTMLGIVFEIIQSGACPENLSPFLHFLSANLERLQASESTECVESSTVQRDVLIAACTSLLFLFQLRPVNTKLFESFAHCCGSIQGGAGWILCSMVNVSNDEIRGIGIRTISAYLDVTSPGTDAALTLAPIIPQVKEVEAPNAADAVASNVRRASNRIGQLAKGLAAMGPSVRSIVLSPSKLTARVIFKLLWHFLKSHRYQLSEFTNTALMSLTTDDNGVLSSKLSSYEYLRDNLIAPSKTKQKGFALSIEWARKALTQTGELVGKSFRNPLATGTILRLLRYFDDRQKDKWLRDLLSLARSSRKCVALLASLPDWEPSLFQLISDSLESVRALASTEPQLYASLSSVVDTCNGATASSREEGTSSSPESNLRIALARLDICLDLFTTLLGHLLRAGGGDQILDAVERTASLQRTCVNGTNVLLLILSRFCSDIYDHGTILEIGSISAEDWKRVDLEQDSLPLKHSARLVTDAILSQGVKGLDMPSAVRSWRSLRHLTEVVVATVTKSGLGVVDLFDYSNQRASAIDEVSGGLHGIRLPDGRIGGTTAWDYAKFTCQSSDKQPYLTGMHSSEADDKLQVSETSRDVDRRLCVSLAVQNLTLLDAFIFPESLDTPMQSSQLQGLALVRNSEARLGTAQGPLLSSAIRLSFLLLSVLEPCSVKFLQSASRLRCLLVWALELVRESTGTSPAVAFAEGTAHVDRLLLAIVLHSHRALGRCAALLSEIENSSHGTYFSSRESQRKYHRRLLRAALELRDVVSTTFRGRNDVLRATLSTEAFEALRASLEGHTPGNKNQQSKESVVRDFLSSRWVEGFQDVETRFELIIPEQVSMDTISLNNEDTEVAMQGVFAVEKLSQETNDIVMDFEKALDSCFKDYLEAQRKWTETDAVRELEYEGDTIAKRLAEKQKIDASEVAREGVVRRAGAESRWRAISRQVVHPWKDPMHWRLPKYTDRLGRRMILVENLDFNSHSDASYERALGKDQETEEVERKAQELTEVMRRNAEAFTSKDELPDDSGTDEDTSHMASDGDSSLSIDEVGTDASSDTSDDDHPILEQDDNDESWDKITTDEIGDIDEEGDGDGWAKAFIWSESETVVARFEPVVIVSLQSYVEGKVLLSSHGLYFLQTSDEMNVMTKEPIAVDNTSPENRGRRWRLSRLTEVHGRRHMLRPQALELFFADCDDLFLNFPSGTRERDRFHAKLRNSCKVPMLWSPRSLNPRTVFRKSKITELWQKRKISTFEYLMAVNRMAGRSLNDLTQYPVFPWVLSDYTSETLDLNDSRIYRDLSKPIGALNPDRLAQLLERYNDLELFGFTEAEKFLFGSHYSSPGIILHFLLRLEPFATMAIDLQSGRFDCPDRLFYDISASWNGCMTSTSDMKELIPEFFYLPELLLNTNNFPLGRLQSGALVDNVKLPPWAKGSAYEFVRINRLALESEYVSKHINHWIDLIFGFKQRGSEAEAAHNIFHHLSYEGSVDLDKITDEVDRMAAESHIQNFGQTPSQLSAVAPHPVRYPLEDCWEPLISSAAVAGHLRCHTPAKQFANKRSEHAKGAVAKLLILSDTVLAIYADMSLGTYRWCPSNKQNRLRMEKLRPLPLRELSTSRVAMKRGSEVPEGEYGSSAYVIGASSFSMTFGGHAKEEQRKKAVMPSNILIPSGENPMATSEASVLIASCGYWDDTVKIHTSDTFRVVASETGGHRGPIRCLSTGDDGGLMITGGNDGARIWVVDRPDMAAALSDGYTQTALGASTDGEQLIRCCHVLWGHDSPVVCVDLNSDLDLAVSGDESGRICIHTLRRGEFVRSFDPPAVSRSDSAGAVRRLSLGPSGILVAHMDDTGLHTFTVNGVRLCSIDAGEKLNDMRICSDDQILISGGERCQVLVRTVTDLRVCSMLDLSKHGAITCIGLTPEDLNPVEQFLFIGSENGMITLVDKDPMSKEKGKDTIAL